VIDAITADADASALVVPTLAGNGAEDITTPSPAVTNLTLSGGRDLFTFEINDTSVDLPGTVRSGHIAVDIDLSVANETALAAALATTLSSERTDEPEEAAVVSELRPLVARALAELTPVDRAVIVLREIEGLRYGAIGDALGRSTENIKVTLHRARKRLREHLLAVVQR
ncbi:MAG: RNA polymerase sigma factor, partial [Phycisphaerae bacterium]